MLRQKTKKTRIKNQNMTVRKDSEIMHNLNIARIEQQSIIYGCLKQQRKNKRMDELFGFVRSYGPIFTKPGKQLRTPYRTRTAYRPQQFNHPHSS